MRRALRSGGVESSAGRAERLCGARDRGRRRHVAGVGCVVVGYNAGRSFDSESAALGGNRTTRASVAGDLATAVFRYRESLLAAGAAAAVGGGWNRRGGGAELTRAPRERECA